MNIKFQLFAIFVFIIFLNACQQKEQTQTIPLEPTPPQSNQSNKSFDAEQKALAESVGTQAYLFGASIMTQYYFRNRMMKMIKNGGTRMFNESVEDGLHFNEIIHTKHLTTHQMKIGGTPNVDTRYSIIFFNLEKGAQVLHVPAIKNRYYSINITDAYLGNRPYICSRLGDTNGGKYIFTGPDWEGTIPSGVKEIKMPQNNFLVVVRIYVQNRTTDNDKVTEIQNKFSLESVDKYTGKTSQDKLMAVEPIKMTEGLEYFQQMAKLMQANPPEGHQAFIWNLFEQVGISRDKPFDVENVNPNFKEGLLSGLEKGKSIIKWRGAERGTKTNSGWYYSLGMGEDHDNYMFRSEWAVQGLTVGSAKEALFFNIFKDSNGETLDGQKQYTITLTKDQMPPVNAFWSITSYNSNFDLVQNSDYHYGVSVRNKDMKYNDDGSITFYVQHEMPKTGKSNWIPTPKEGSFKMNFRFYNPKEILFTEEGANKYLPPVKPNLLKD